MVPAKLLPEGAAVCYFSPYAYLEYFVAKTVAPALARSRAVGDRVRVWEGTHKPELQPLREAIDRSAATMTILFDVPFPGPPEVRCCSALATL